MAGKPSGDRVTMTDAALAEVYQRFHRTGPEWGADQLTNHGPMAAEVLVRRGRAEVVPAWVDRYLRRLDDMPRPTGEIIDATWPQALGDGRRIGDWSVFFTRQLAAGPWPQVLATWWPRLLPGVAASATHGVIRTGHAVRALLADGDDPVHVTELAHGLAYWAARWQPVPGTEDQRPASVPAPQTARTRWRTSSPRPSITATSTSSSSPTPPPMCTRAPATRRRWPRPSAPSSWFPARPDPAPPTARAPCRRVRRV